jgi:hypothetical protein
MFVIADAKQLLKWECPVRMLSSAFPVKATKKL